MKIERFLPAVGLKPYIKEFMIIESDLETTNKTLPDTAVVMSFRFRGRVLKMEGDKKDHTPATAVAGLRTSSRLFCYLPETSNLLVIFNEGGLTAFCRIP